MNFEQQQSNLKVISLDLETYERLLKYRELLAKNTKQPNLRFREAIMELLRATGF